MKINTIITIILSSVVFLGCTKDGETELQKSSTFLFQEDFNTTVEADDNSTLNTVGWINYAQTGTKLWTEQFYKNGYAAFSPFGATAESSNIGWLISPSLNMDLQDGEKLSFQSAPSFLRSRDFTLDLMVSTDYDGTNFASSSWENIPFLKPTLESEWYTYVNSGVIDLSKYKGKLRFAFKVTGAGNNANLRGTYQIDNINLYY